MTFNGEGSELSIPLEQRKVLFYGNKSCVIIFQIAFSRRITRCSDVLTYLSVSWILGSMPTTVRIPVSVAASLLLPCLATQVNKPGDMNVNIQLSRVVIILAIVDVLCQNIGLFTGCCDPLSVVCNNVTRAINPFNIDVSVHGWYKNSKHQTH